MIPFSLYNVYEGIFLKLWSKVLHIFLLFYLYFSNLNLKYLKLTKMDITRFAMKLFILTWQFYRNAILIILVLNLSFNR